MKKSILIMAILSISSTCLGQGFERFESDLTGENKPWLHENFDIEGDKFTFAVFSDLQSGERPRVFDIAVAQLSLLRPELIINVGDLIPGPSDDADELHGMWDTFEARTTAVKGPVFFVGGNHDLGEETIRGATSQQVWNERYGST